MTLKRTNICAADLSLARPGFKLAFSGLNHLESIHMISRRRSLSRFMAIMPVLVSAGSGVTLAEVLEGCSLRAFSMLDVAHYMNLTNCVTSAFKRIILSVTESSDLT